MLTDAVHAVWRCHADDLVCVCGWVWFTEVQTVGVVCVWYSRLLCFPLWRQKIYRSSEVCFWSLKQNPESGYRDTENVCMYFWSWGGMTGSCEKYDCLSADVGEERAQLCWMCFILLQQSVMRVQQTRWPGKDLYKDPCSWMIVMLVFIYPADTCSHTCILSSEDKNLCVLKSSLVTFSEDWP